MLTTLLLQLKLARMETCHASIVTAHRTPHASSIMSHMVQCGVIIYNALAHVPTPACASRPLSPSSRMPLQFCLYLAASLAVVAWSGNYNPLVDVVLASGLVTALGLCALVRGVRVNFRLRILLPECPRG